MQIDTAILTEIQEYRVTADPVVASDHAAGADAHGWDIEVMESETGGARFEITGVELVAGVEEPNSN